MFLFTNTPTPASPAAPPPPPTGPAVGGSPIVEAIRRGAEASGTSFDYLLATAKRESALDPAAKAPTSSATGLFQFIEQTWLGLVKSEGSKLGLSDYASAITARSDGSLGVGDPGARQAILKLREDPTLAATLAGTLAQKNGDVLAGEIGRTPNAGDLYVAHVLGARGAAELIKSAQRNPGRAAALDFPDAAAANRNIFYESGRPRGAAEVYGVLAGGQANAPNPLGPPPPAAAVAPVAPATTPTGQTASGARPFVRQDGPAHHGLFQTDARPGPVSDAVAKIWRTNATGHATQTAALSFFPRDKPIAGVEPDAAGARAGTASEAAVPASLPAAPSQAETMPASLGQPAPGIPLPPPRPRDAGLPAGNAATGEARPLNLLSYMKWRGP